MKASPSFLLVEDHEQFAAVLRRTIERYCPEATVSHCATLSEALSCDAPLDLVLLDLHLPDNEDTTSIRRVKERHPQALVAVMTGADDIGVEELMDAGADAVLLKRWQMERFANALRDVVARAS
jgi:DNA-binding NarL/FixJ family response regulator